MISVTRFNGSKLYINAELVQSVEATPDTVITLTNKVIILVKESPEEVASRMIAYQQEIRSSQFIQKLGG
jgi:flagellar protein FlbD